MRGTAPDNRATPDNTANLELRDYLRVLRRRWLSIVLATAIVTIVAVGFSITRPTVYEASAGVLLDSGYSQSILFAEDDNIPNIDEQVTTETDLMKTGLVKAAVEEDLGYLPDVRIVSADVGDENAKTRLINVVAQNGDAATAARQADDYARSYIDWRRDDIDEDLQTTIEERGAALKRLDVQAANTSKRLDELAIAIPMTNGDEQRVLVAEQARLRSEVESGSISNRQTQIQQKLDVLYTAVSNNSENSIFKRTQADLPSSPVSPQPKRTGLIAVLVGLALGLLIAFVRDYYDDTFRTKEDLDAVTGGIPVLALVPAVSGWRDRNDTVLETMTHPGSAAAESYRTLRTALEFAAIEHKVGIIHVTSSTSGEGKTTTAANLAVSLASAGQTVVLVDCDLRRPRTHEFFGLSNDVGFTTVLRGDEEVHDTLQSPTEVPGLHVLTSGPPPPNPSELLSSQSTRRLLETLDRFADHVVIDSPPILPVADAAILAGYADSTLLVVTAGSTAKRSVGRSIELLEQANAPLEGLVFNQVGAEATYGYGYGYGYQY